MMNLNWVYQHHVKTKETAAENCKKRGGMSTQSSLLFSFCRASVRKKEKGFERRGRRRRKATHPPFFPTWLPDGYSQISRSHVFGPSGFWTMAPLCYWIGPPRPPPWRNPRKGRNQILLSGNTASQSKLNYSSGSLHPQQRQRTEQLEKLLAKQRSRAFGGGTTIVETQRSVEGKHQSGFVDFEVLVMCLANFVNLDKESGSM